MTFSHYEDVPAHLVEGLIEKHKKDQENAH
jgi:hypothetical protein